MSNSIRIVIIGCLLAVVIVVMRGKQQARVESIATADATPAQTTATGPASAPASGPLPRMVDLGAGKCIPCKMMAPILDELKKEYAGRVEVVFIDVWQDPPAAEKYGINSIPTQVFFDASGKERFRHEGFYGKEEILSKWRELGMLPASPSPAQ